MTSTTVRAATVLVWCWILLLPAVSLGESVSYWSSPSVLGEAGRFDADPQVSVNARGAAVALWVSGQSEGAESEIRAASRPTDYGRWEAAVTVAKAETFSPAVAIDSGGSAIAAWSSGYINNEATVWAAVRPIGHVSWSAPVKLGITENAVGYRPSVAFDSRGNGFVVWGSSRGIRAAIRRSQSGRWQTPINVSATGGEDARVVLDARGDAIVAWEGFEGIQAAIRPKGSRRWQAPVSISGPGLGTGGSPGGPSLAVDRQGTVVAIWSLTKGVYNNVPHIIQSASKQPGHPWTPPVDVSQPGWDTGAPDVAMDSRGDAVAVWSAAMGKDVEVSGTPIVQAATRLANGMWQPLIDLTSPDSVPSNRELDGEPKVAVGPRGNTIAVWEHVSDGESIQAAEGTAGGAWQSHTELGPSTFGGGQQLRFSNPQVAVDDRGNAVAVWSSQVPTNRMIIQMSEYRPLDLAFPVMSSSGRGG